MGLHVQNGTSPLLQAGTKQDTIKLKCKLIPLDFFKKWCVIPLDFFKNSCVIPLDFFKSLVYVANL